MYKTQSALGCLVIDSLAGSRIKLCKGRVSVDVMLDGFVSEGINHRRVSFSPAIKTCGEAVGPIGAGIQHPIHKSPCGAQIFVVFIGGIVLEQRQRHISRIAHVAAYLVPVLIPDAGIPCASVIPAGQTRTAFPAWKGADIPCRVSIAYPGHALAVMRHGVNESIQNPGRLFLHPL
ncbi:hypothetical protein SDC9_165064 [bioreactor metagenome]|uniref:Uncharacterized protein n=1 Tax=bioreactor metagenome TaxID=1076179 RepID=A0A645FVY1_9ZZZZ